MDFVNLIVYYLNYSLVLFGDFMAIDLIQIGKTIRQERKRQGFSQEDLAQMLDISHVTLMKIEKGIDTVQVGTFFNVLETLGIPHTVGNALRPQRAIKSVMVAPVKLDKPLHKTKTKKPSLQDSIKMAVARISAKG